MVFWKKVDKTSHPGGCWLWLGDINKQGYGQQSAGHRSRRAHRVAYILVNGEIPGNNHLDHKCRNKSCVNPEHLEPVTQAENNRRYLMFKYGGDGTMTHCKNGHEFNIQNTTMRKRKNGKPRRRCRACAANDKEKFLNKVRI